MSYMVTVEPEIGPDAEERYAWTVTRDPHPNGYEATLDDVLAFRGGYSGRSLQHAPGHGTASTLKEAEAQAKLAIDIERANIKLRDRIASGQKPRKRFLIQ